MTFPPSHTLIFNTHEHYHDHPSTSLNTFPLCHPQHFEGGEPFILKRSMSFSGIERNCDELHGDEELSDEGLLQCEDKKKKRLNLEQVKELEKSFELGNKLEPQRKFQLAKALGLKPRQIAIWFQNRRARWKTRQLEKEYKLLKMHFEQVKADNGALKAHNHKLLAQLKALKGREWCEAETKNFKKETESCWRNGSDNSSDINLDLSRTPVLSGHVSSQNSKSILQPTSSKPNSITQLLQDEAFGNMFHNIDEQHNFWPWLDQHHQFH
ncbi:hypothetical protein VNO77_21230 [Canavalia gladiata]|uniref:Homeobox-leucine zipper protein n=1 Tax=Canavalia gladiata TaxID=3824 RepID=A0AAN9LU64_CANGL